MKIWRRKQSGAVMVVLAIIVILVATALAGYSVLKNDRTTTEQIVETCARDLRGLLPAGAIVLEETKIDFEDDDTEKTAIAYRLDAIVGEEETTGSAGLVIFLCDGGVWRVGYEEAANEQSGNAMRIEVLEAATKSGLFVEEVWAGSGTIGSWHIVVSMNNGRLGVIDRGPVLSDVLEPRGYVFLGYNTVEIRDGLIIETIPGYSEGTSRCCPDRPMIEVTYRFTGGDLAIVGVRELSPESRI